MDNWEIVNARVCNVENAAICADVSDAISDVVKPAKLVVVKDAIAVVTAMIFGRASCPLVQTYIVAPNIPMYGKYLMYFIFATGASG